MIELVDWGNVLEEENPSFSYDIFLKGVKRCYEEAFPKLYAKIHKKYKTMVNKRVTSEK